MPAKQVAITKTTTRTKVKVKKSSGAKRGNSKKCSKCGRFI